MRSLATRWRDSLRTQHVPRMTPLPFKNFTCQVEQNGRIMRMLVVVPGGQADSLAIRLNLLRGALFPFVRKPSATCNRGGACCAHPASAHGAPETLALVALTREPAPRVLQVRKSLCGNARIAAIVISRQDRANRAHGRALEESASHNRALRIV